MSRSQDDWEAPLGQGRRGNTVKDISKPSWDLRGLAPMSNIARRGDSDSLRAWEPANGAHRSSCPVMPGPYPDSDFNTISMSDRHCLVSFPHLQQ
jgi:hypothetical protein